MCSPLTESRQLNDSFEPWQHMNIGMRSMQELFFSWVGRNGTLCVPYVFVIFKRTKILYYFTPRERGKT